MFFSGKEFVSFCSCPRTLGEAEFKQNLVMNLVGNFSRKTRLQSVIWLFLVALGQVHSEK